ncbi:MAG: hypothetical protein IMY69_04695 [Bacteroidetes bacterium]|nr:hypothetical protein [Bacteroidota bacterium]
METKKKVNSCEECKMRKFAERKPNSFWAKVWRWHTKWCPGWKAYQKEIDQQA